MNPTWIMWSKTILLALAMLGNHFLPLLPEQLVAVVGPLLIILNRVVGSQPPLTLTPTMPRVMQ